MATAAVESMSEQFRDESTEPSKGELKDQDIDLDSNANQHPDQDSGKRIDTSHVTIQLSQSLHSNQQKMEELIAHLSQSGQLKDDRKITIEVRFIIKINSFCSHRLKITMVKRRKSNRIKVQLIFCPISPPLLLKLLNSLFMLSSMLLYNKLLLLFRVTLRSRPYVPVQTL